MEAAPANVAARMMAAKSAKMRAAHAKGEGRLEVSQELNVFACYERGLSRWRLLFADWVSFTPWRWAVHDARVFSRSMDNVRLEEAT